MKSFRHRKILFQITAILIPVIGLVLLETGLRISNYGFSHRLFLNAKSMPGYKATNTEISRLFFPVKDDARTGIRSVFEKEKKPGTIRIFVIGESSAYGYPYTHRVSFARMLEDRLMHSFSDQNVEMINLSVTALNSNAFRSFTREIIRNEPDAIIIYAGHNEYYGALGVASHSKMKNALIVLKRFKVVQLAFDLSGKLRARFRPENNSDRKSFMQRMSGRQLITLGSPEYEMGIEQFRINMDKMISKFRKSEIPVFISTLVSNEKDQKPFVSSFTASIDTASYSENLRTAEQFLNDHDIQQTDSLLNVCLRSDSSYAMTWYLKGKASLEKGDFRIASIEFTKSKELDALRFRAPEAINDEIRDFNKKYENIYLVEGLEDFREFSENRIISNTLVTDHLHPNIRGHFVLANAYYDAIIRSGVLGTVSDTVTFGTAWEEIPVTAVDSLYGLFTDLIMKEQWPFYQETQYVPDATEVPVRLTMKIFNREISYNSALDSLFHYYIGQNNMAEAIRTARSVSLDNPGDRGLQERIAMLYLQERNFENAVFHFENAFSLKPDIETGRRIVLSMLQLDELEAAVPYLEYLKREDPGDNMSTDILSRVNEAVMLKKQINEKSADIDMINKLTGFYLFTGNLSGARKYIDLALALDAANPVAIEYQRNYENAERKNGKTVH